MKTVSFIRRRLYWYRGRISYYLEDYENARTYLEKARDEKGYEAVLFLGKTYETLGDNNYAISVYNTYLESNPDAAQVWNQIGLCKLNMEDNEGALQAFQTAMQIENNGMMQTLKMNEIIAYEHLHEYKKASVLMESYLKSYPDDETAQREYLFLKTRWFMIRIAVNDETIHRMMASSQWSD